MTYEIPKILQMYTIGVMIPWYLKTPINQSLGRPMVHELVYARTTEAQLSHVDLGQALRQGLATTSSLCLHRTTSPSPRSLGGTGRDQAPLGTSALTRAGTPHKPRKDRGDNSPPARLDAIPAPRSEDKTTTPSSARPVQ
jgi:hypothetical protein